MRDVLGFLSRSCAGLTRASIKAGHFVKAMDGRVKPGHDRRAERRS
ncbi:hypothetical protein [Pseudorhodoplanes sp.]|jgi:hypothetical protein|nr:hypothetical protein [Pseudorhodoplanes sp.]HWV43290.1 hypothetical protein [Pseudorhodoplanes sp.]